MGEQAEAPGIVMVDDNALAAGAMERRFAQSRCLRWLGWTDEVSRAPGLVRDLRPAVVLLDVDMPMGGGFGLLGRLITECPFAAVVMFSGHDQPSLVERALNEGASGYIHKDEPTAVIVDLLIKASAGDCVLSPLVMRTYMGASGTGV